MLIPHRTLKFYAYLAALLTIGIGIALLRPSPVLSDAGLTGEVQRVFGIARTETSELHQLAHQRAVEVSCEGCFNHDGRPDGTAEVLAYNNGLALDEDGNVVAVDPAQRAVQQWLGSPGHAAILSDPDFALIGCGSHFDGELYWFVCLLAWPAPAPTPAPTAVSTNPPVSQDGKLPDSGNTPTPQPVLLPDTAINSGG